MAKERRGIGNNLRFLGRSVIHTPLDSTHLVRPPESVFSHPVRRRVGHAEPVADRTLHDDLGHLDGPVVSAVSHHGHVVLRRQHVEPRAASRQTVTVT